MRRKLVHPYGQSSSGMRIISMIMALLVLGMLYQRLRDPATWRLLADDHEPRNSTPAKVAPAEPEIVVPGPNDLDEEEFARAQEDFEKIVDLAEIKSGREYDGYWRLIKWSRTEPLADLEKRARDDIPFAQLFEQPEKYRGQLIYLRMHVRRVIPYKSKDYPDGVKQVCEAWGWTDESLSFPYVVVLPDPPPDLPIGTDIRAEVVFSGYFFKIMTYRAFDHVRKAPLLIGRLRVVSPGPRTVQSKTDPWTIAIVLVGGLILIGASVWISMNTRKRPGIKMLPKELSSMEQVSEPNFDNLFDQIVTEPRRSVVAMAPAGGSPDLQQAAQGATTSVSLPSAFPEKEVGAAEPQARPDGSNPDSAN